ncbi:DNA primase [Aphanothece sacrum]|uniref:DNA primase n=1 Tax=Aphanothece sacrum FPU1 TaxID=1920663 RepID=A0A401III5_APHSA|nr:DNA primase [Aphanothece sacrum]GBF81103.1 DNA primase [Aphanothece sacrum FPU1]GBF85504.1 DNA primase [Aphanothece sacrum FPU3]
MDVPRLHPDTLEEVKQRVDIYDVISDYVVLKKQGKDYVGLCPFHDEKTPSFSVSPTKQFYHCFGCGEGGTAIKFLMELGKQSFTEVIFELAKRYQIPIKTLEPEERQELQRQLSLKEQLYEIISLTSSFYQHALYQPQGEIALNYLKDKRQLKDETIQKFELGYAPSGWETLYHYLVEQKRYPLTLVEEAGLIKPRKNGSGYYDQFRDRLMIPIRDIQGRIIAFGSRTLENEEPKYLNSPETPLFNKGSILFGLDIAKNTIRSLDKVVVVEGYFDVIKLHEVGITNTVASLGTAFSQTQLKQLLRYTESKQVIFNFDADKAGIKATQRAIKEIESLIYSGQVQLKILNLPDGKDADEFITSHSDSLTNYQKLIDNAPLWLDWQIQQLLVGKDLKKANEFQEVTKQMIELLNHLSDSNQRTYYINYCAEILSQSKDRSMLFYVDNLYRQLKKPQLVNKKFSVNKVEDTLLKEAEETLLRIYLHFPEYRSEILNHLEEKDLVFSLSNHRFLWQQILEIEEKLERPDNQESNQLIYQLQERILQLSNPINNINHLFRLNETKESEDRERFSLVINAAIISMEKTSLEKYCRYCYEKYMNLNIKINVPFDSQEDFSTFQYYFTEHRLSKQKIMKLERLLTISQLDIYGG